MKASDLVARFGGHHVGDLGIDLEAAEGPGRWLVAAGLYGGRVDEAVAREAARALATAGLADPQQVARARPEALEAALRGTRYPAPEAAARKLWRICHALAEHDTGSLDALAARCESLDELGARLAALAPGFGAASVARFLRPLRDRWIQAREIPLHPAARAAAVHLGLLAEGEDEEGEPGALRAALEDDPATPSLADAEAALTRLGSAACARNRVRRCPLGDACPLRANRSQR